MSVRRNEKNQVKTHSQKEKCWYHIKTLLMFGKGNQQGFCYYEYERVLFSSVKGNSCFLHSGNRLYLVFIVNFHRDWFITFDTDRRKALIRWGTF